jgi:hypothetical protein
MLTVGVQEVVTAAFSLQGGSPGSGIAKHGSAWSGHAALAGVLEMAEKGEGALVKKEI